MKQPEKKIRNEVRKFLEYRGWFVILMHGNLFQLGIPDLFICHAEFGQRWVEVKLPEMKGSRWTSSQSNYFPEFIKHGSHIWVLCDASQEEYDLLFKPANLKDYMDLETGKKLKRK